MPTIEEVEGILKAEVLRKETRLRQTVYGVMIDPTKKTYIPQLNCQCVLGCYLLGRKCFWLHVGGDHISFGNGALLSDAASHLGILVEDACDIMTGFDRYPAGPAKGRPWIALGRRMAEWADNLGILDTIKP